MIMQRHGKNSLESTPLHIFLMLFHFMLSPFFAAFCVCCQSTSHSDHTDVIVITAIGIAEGRSGAATVDTGVLLWLLTPGTKNPSCATDSHIITFAGDKHFGLVDRNQWGWRQEL
jgi:hypothetical protein